MSRIEDGNVTMTHGTHGTGHTWSTKSMNSIERCVQQSPSIQKEQKKE